MIQRLCETFRYGDILNKAAVEPNPHLRLAYAAAFCSCGYDISPYRTFKFFNPILGETFEMVDNDLNIRYFGEQVCHHPAISAMYTEGENFIIYGNNNAKGTFNLFQNCLEFEMLGKTILKFFNYDEQISFTKPKTIIRNIMFGEIYVETVGKCIVMNNNTGDTIELTFYDKGTPDKSEFGHFDGVLKDIDGHEQLKCDGNVLSHFDVSFKDNYGKEQKRTLWTAEPSTETHQEKEAKFFMSDFAINMNNDNPELLKSLPRSDTRHRPDQRHLEHGNLEEASKEKARLEEKQRAARKEEARKNKIYKPKFFTETYDDFSGDLIYIFTRDYWEDKKNDNLGDCLNIF